MTAHRARLHGRLGSGGLICHDPCREVIRRRQFGTGAIWIFPHIQWVSRHARPPPSRSAAGVHFVMDPQLPIAESLLAPWRPGPLSRLDDVGRWGGRDSGAMSEALDGNSIGGLLIDVFGADMTAASSTCAPAAP